MTLKTYLLSATPLHPVSFNLDHPHTVERSMCVNRISCSRARLVRWACMAALLSGGSPALGADEIRVAETRTVSMERDPDRAEATHELRLALYGFTGTRWSPEQIFAAAREGSKLLEQCGVAVLSVELKMLDTPRPFRYYDTPASRELLRRIEVARPAVFFVEDTLNNPAFDAEAIGRENAVNRPELTDTIWIAYEARDLPQTFAHELVHVLSNSGEHSTEPGNLMRATTSWRNTRLTEAQCARLRWHGETSRLLAVQPRPSHEQWGVRSGDPEESSTDQ